MHDLHTNSLRSPFARRSVGLAAKTHASAAGGQQPSDDLRQRAFACAIGAQHGVDLPLVHLKIDTSQHGHQAVLFLEGFRGKQGQRHGVARVSAVTRSTGVSRSTTSAAGSASIPKAASMPYTAS